MLECWRWEEIAVASLEHEKRALRSEAHETWARPQM